MKETFVVKTAGDEARFSGGAQEGFGTGLGGQFGLVYA